MHIHADVNTRSCMRPDRYIVISAGTSVTVSTYQSGGGAIALRQNITGVATPGAVSLFVLAGRQMMVVSVQRGSAPALERPRMYVS
jgi:hypothetical protein